MAMKPKRCVTTPKGDGKSLEEISVVEGGSLEPAPSAIAWPREWMVWMASSASPLSVSATMGMQSTLASRHAERLAASLRCTLICRAKPWVTDARERVCC